MNSRLVASTRAKEASEEALLRAEAQAIRAEQKVEQQAARHEERLTELHSVIAELGRQLERQRATVITEEDESGEKTIVIFNYIVGGFFLKRLNIYSICDYTSGWWT